MKETGGIRMETVVKKFKDFLATGWGRSATKFLKEGAAFRLVIGEQAFSLRKTAGEMVIRPEDPQDYDVLLETTPSAIECLSEAESENDYHERVGRVTNQSTPEEYLRMKIMMEPTERNVRDFYWKGYLMWARRLGFGV
jgi:hypothetical protein